MKYVYMFDEGRADMRNLLGGKGANLAEMTGLGLPVPYGFTVTTEACTRYYSDGKQIVSEIIDEIFSSLKKVEAKIGRIFGDKENPLLVSVRSGARASMPGMMDTVLNLGLTDETINGLINMTNGNVRFAYDSYRRFIQMFSDVVMEIDKEKFEHALKELKKSHGYEYDTDLTADDLKELVAQFKAIYKKEIGADFPQDPKVQLIEATKAVFRSWDNPRAISYRRMEGIPSSWGTAVNIQSMVFGNTGDDSGTGVAFTRDPSTGEKVLYGEYLMNAQGEDVVAGIRTPQHISTLKDNMPEVYEQFVSYASILEKHYRDMQDMEFTIEHGTLYMLQTRNGKRTAASAVIIACALVDEGLITIDEAVMKIDPKSIDTLLHPVFDTDAVKKATVIARGIDASPGAGSGKVYFTAEDAKAAAERGEKVLLVRHETSPEDIEGMAASQGILTSCGGKTSHAAVVARGMGRCCVAGCSSLLIDYDKHQFTCEDGTVVKEGDFISIDGSTGSVFLGTLATSEAKTSEQYNRIMKWADERRTLKVRTNADNPHDAAVAVGFGAEGIGLCRTEHMFFDEERIPAVREMIVSKTKASREAALEKLLPMQRDDFKGIYIAMGERPVTIRLLDPPLHEFLPTKDEDIKALAKTMKLSFDELKSTIIGLHEANPMMGHRGCRLAVTYPEIAEMQARAIIEAAIEVINEKGLNIVPEIMIPLVGEAKELAYVKSVVVETAEKVMAERGKTIKYLVGTMIEIPRAALTADEVAEHAEFFSFGTNDLSQMTFGFSRDDAGKFLPDYYSRKIFENDPFARLDTVGVGKLMKIAIELGKKTRPNIKLGICGEHGGEPSSVMFCHEIGLQYVSCSPYRVPIARLAAAQAAIMEKNASK